MSADQKTKNSINSAVDQANEKLMERLDEIRKDGDLDDEEMAEALHDIDSDLADRWNDWIAG